MPVEELTCVRAPYRRTSLKACPKRKNDGILINMVLLKRNLEVGIGLIFFHICPKGLKLKLLLLDVRLIANTISDSSQRVWHVCACIHAFAELCKADAYRTHLCAVKPF